MKFVLPGYKYLGPGNNLYEGTPVNKADSIARKHDFEYNSAVNKSQVFDSDNRAILSFFNEYSENKTFGALVGALGLGAKTSVEQFFDTSIYPNTESMSKRPNEQQYSFDHIKKLNSGSSFFDTPPMSPSNDNEETMVGQEVPMETNSDAAAQRGVAPGAAGSAGTTKGHILTMPMPVFNNYVTLEFNQCYRWQYEAKLPSYRKSTITTENQTWYDHFICFRPGSMINYPVENLFAYLSPGEYANLKSTFTEVIVEEVAVQIENYGVRMPFVTNEPAALTANTNTQYPITHWVDIDKDYAIGNDYDTNWIEDVRLKMNGGRLKNWSNGVSTTSFPNLSARATSREINNDACMFIPAPITYVGTDRVRDDDNLPGDPDIHKYAYSLNGNILGPCFHYNYKPKDGTVIVNSTHLRKQGHLPISNAQALPMVNILHPNRLRSTPYIAAGNETQPGDGTQSAFNTNQFIYAEPKPYETALIENQIWDNYSNPRVKARQPLFLIGMQIIRNKDDSLLNATWEFTAKHHIKLRCRQGTKGIYHFNTNQPPSQNLYPDLQQGFYGTSGTVANGTLGQKVTETINGNVSYPDIKGIFNRKATYIRPRVAADVTPVNEIVTRSRSKQMQNNK